MKNNLKGKRSKTPSLDDTFLTDKFKLRWEKMFLSKKDSNKKITINLLNSTSQKEKIK